MANANRTGEVLVSSQTVTSATTTYGTQKADEFQVAYIVVDISAYTASQTLDIRVEAKDQASGSWVTIGRIPKALNAAGTYVFLIGESGNYGGEIDIIAAPLPWDWRVACVTTTSDSITFSVGVLPVGR